MDHGQVRVKGWILEILVVLGDLFRCQLSLVGNVDWKVS
jgi:hypothetical protein